MTFERVTIRSRWLFEGAFRRYPTGAVTDTSSTIYDLLRSGGRVRLPGPKGRDALIPLTDYTANHGRGWNLTRLNPPTEAYGLTWKFIACSVIVINKLDGIESADDSTEWFLCSDIPTVWRWKENWDQLHVRGQRIMLASDWLDRSACNVVYTENTGSTLARRSHCVRTVLYCIYCIHWYSASWQRTVGKSFAHNALQCNCICSIDLQLCVRMCTSDSWKESNFTVQLYCIVLYWQELCMCICLRR